MNEIGKSIGSRSVRNEKRARAANRLAMFSILFLSACIPAPYQPNVDHRAPARHPQLPTDPNAVADPVETPITPASNVGVTNQPALTPVVPNATSVPAQSYVVKSGDTLRGIGNRTGAGSEIIALTNSLRAPFTIRPGQRLRIPGGRYHLVEEGQTGLAIAQAYGVSWSAIVARNSITEPFVLRRGQRLLLPDTTPPQSMTLEQRAAAFKLDIDDAISGSAAPSDAAGTDAGDPSLQNPPRRAQSSSAPPFSETFAWPLNGRVIARFGPAQNGIKSHGVDIAAAAGTTVQTAASGTVSFASDQVSVFGGLILIDHGSGWVSAYGYVRNLAVHVGQKLARGTVIAQVDDKGVGGQSRLHFEIRKDRKPVDPLTKLPKR